MTKTRVSHESEMTGVLRLALAATLLCVPLSAAAGNWPQWRGPDADGVAEPGNYPVQFSSTNHVRWKVQLPGSGSSTPAVQGDHIFVTASDSGQDAVFCFDREGRKRWQTDLGRLSEAKHKAGTSANPSPVTDGQSVFVYFRSGAVAALDFEGKITWQDNLQKRFGENTLWWDLGTSPVLTRENLVIAVMQTGDSYLVALDRATGEVAWKEPRMFDCGRESDQAYTTPTVLKQDGRERLLVWGADHLTMHEASDGRMIWSCDGFNPMNKPMWRVISSQTVGDGVAVLSYARGKRLAGIDIREGTPADRRWLWKRDDIGSDVPSPAVKDGRAYVLKENGRTACIDLRTGKDIWTTRLPSGHDVFYASPVVAGDLIYYTSFDGTISVGRGSDRFELLATNRMGEQVTATPVPLDDELLIRGFEHLYCIRADP